MKQLYPDASGLDFEIRTRGAWHEIVFDDSLGYQPLWDYAPKARFDPGVGMWRIEAGDAKFVAAESPIMELVIEMRGYLLAGGDVEEDAVCVDAGPGTSGLYGLYCARRATRGRVVFVEADPRAQETLLKNIQSNALDNATLAPLALYPARRVAFHRHQDVNASHVVRKPDAHAASTPARSLLSLLQDEAMTPDRPLYVKMDIEGSETALLDDIGALVTRHQRGLFAVASYHVENGEPTSATLERYFAAMPEIECRTLFPGHPTTFIAHRENRRRLVALDKIARKTRTLEDKG